MSMPVPLPFVSQLFTRKLFVFSGHSLIVYDYLITFSCEIKYIWNAPWTVVKAGFLLNRYGNLLCQTYVMMEETGRLNHGSAKFCNYFGLFCTLFMLFSVESIRILVLIRARAIYGCTRRVTTILIALYVLYILALMPSAVIYPQIVAHSSSISYFFLAQVNVCVVPTIPNTWIVWFAVMILDSVTLAMVARSLWQLSEKSCDLYTSPLARILVRDSVLFYASSMIHNVFSIICWTVFGSDPRSFLQLAFTQPLVSVIGQRLILNLRRYQARPYTRGDISRDVDRQVAAMHDFLFPDLGADEEQANEEQAKSGKTNDTSRATATDLELEVVEVRRDQGSPHHNQGPGRVE